MIGNWWKNLYECNEQGRIIRTDLAKSKRDVCTGLFDTAKSVSECIVRAFENRTSLRKRASARSWLIKILINVSRSAITKRQKVVLFADPEQYEQASEEPEDYLWSAILELQENVRVVMVLYYYDGFSVREISAMLDIPEGTTKTRLSAGRKQLTKWLENGKER